jgi:Lipopolysaccharide-assembly
MVSMRRSGVVRRAALLLASVCALGACMLSPYHFAGGGLPRNIKTVAVLPFDNQTPVPELQRELLDAMRRQLESRLSLREAAEAKADAIVRGTIVKYEVDVPIGYSSDPQQANSARRQLQLVVDVTILDQSSGKPLWERKGLTAKGEYAERDEAGGRRQAIERVINDVVEGAQSNW